LDPWQRFVLDVAGEFDPTTGRYCYSLVVLVVPRRSGKTTIALVRILTAMLAQPRARCWYGTFTRTGRQVAEALWRDEWLPLLKASPLDPLLKYRESNGSERIAVAGLDSTVRIMNRSGENVRSQNADVVVIDEARGLSGDQGALVEAAVRPAQLTRPQRQTFVMSSAGSADSAYLARYRHLGHAAVAADTGRGVALFEWAAPQGDGIDPYDPAVWAKAHPALDCGRIDVAAIADDADTMSLADFTTEILGWWNPAPTAQVIDAGAWAAAAHPDAEPDGVLAFGVDVGAERATAAVALAALQPSGRIVVEVLEVAQGAHWPVDVLDALHQAHPAAPIAGDALHAAGILGELARRYPSGLTTLALGAADLVRACAQLRDDVATPGRLYHRAQPVLDLALAGAGARKVGDGLAWSRTLSAADVSPLNAVTVAAWAARNAIVAPAPLVVTARY
jgi:hypothetical protein